MPHSYGHDLSWEDIEQLETGDLLHVMLCNFNPQYADEPAYMQNENYMAAHHELNARIKKNAA